MSLPSTEALTDGKLLQRLDAGLGEERHESELHAVLLLERILVARAQFVDGLQVHLVERGQQRLRGLRLHHALGNARAQARHRHALLGARRARAARPAARPAAPARRRAGAALLGLTDNSPHPISRRARRGPTRPASADPALFSSATRLAAGLSLAAGAAAAAAFAVAAFGRGRRRGRARRGAGARALLDQRQDLAAGHRRAVRRA